MRIQKKLHPILGSSTDPTKVAMTIKGIALGLIPLITLLLGANGYDVTTTDLTEMVEALTAVAASTITAYGVGRKIVLKDKK